MVFNKHNVNPRGQEEKIYTSHDPFSHSSKLAVAVTTVNRLGEEGGGGDQERMKEVSEIL